MFFVLLYTAYFSMFFGYVKSDMVLDSFVKWLLLIDYGFRFMVLVGFS